MLDLRYLAAGTILAAFLLSLIATRWLITILTRRAVIDIPNHRSSHDIPKPRGGGIAVVGALLVSWVAAREIFFTGLYLEEVVVIAMILLLAGISFLDDLRNLGARVRLFVQILAVVAGLAVTVPETGLTNGFLPLWLELPLAALAWLWFVNLFNFMDGIDGISGIETISIGLGLLGLFLLLSVAGGVFVPALAMVGAAAGFLVWNWAPSRIFLGDVGSIPLGFLIGWMLIKTVSQDGDLGTWSAILLLPGYYLVDATFTLIKRVLRRENILEAHRQHFYQQAVQKGWSHARTCLGIVAVNAGLIMIAWFGSARFPVLSLLAGAVLVGLLCLWFRRRTVAGQLAE